MSWRYVGASVIGTSHIRTNQSCQDACRCGALMVKGESVFIAVVSDGAGSAQFGELGAELVTRHLYTRMRLRLSKRGNTKILPHEATVRAWVQRTQDHLARAAIERQIPLRQLACTLLGIVASAHGAVCFQVGDGAIVINRGSEGYVVPIWPDNGEYANTTYFVTEKSVLDHLHYARLDSAVEAVALMTDGMERLALNMTANCAHEPFFAPLFGRLAVEPAGRAHNLCEALVAFLSSPAVNTRTDDDKTLVLATVQCKSTDCA